MKPMRTILSFAILFAGCYTHTTVTKESPLPAPSVEVSFRLNDGAYILSNDYRRVDNGYRVVGQLVNKENNNSKAFAGIVSDEQINEVVANELNIGLTGAWVVLAGTVLVLIVYGAFVIRPGW